MTVAFPAAFLEDLTADSPDLPAIIKQEGRV